MSSGLEPTGDQEAVRDAFAGFFAKESTPAVVRAAEPLGFDGGLWQRARAVGLPEMAVTADVTLGDLAVVVEEAGRRLAPIPLVDAMVAARLLRRLDALPGDVADGTAVATFAPRPAAHGRARLVPAGAVASVVLALDGDELVCVRGPAPRAGPANLGTSPVADRILDDERVVVGRGREACEAHAAALDEWRVLTAASLVGLARGALDLAVEYAKARRQFGVPIGSFQAIQHRLADVTTAVEGAALLARRAATDGGRRPLLAPMAMWFATRTARDAAGTSLHVHGGYGFMLEQDVQLYFRRATAWPLALGDPDGELGRVAELLEETGWLLDEGTPGGFRTEVRAFLEEHCTPEVVARAHETGTIHDWGLHRALAARGWLAAEWPVEAGGQGRDAWEMLELAEELARAGAPVDGWGTSNLVAHTLAISGTEHQRREIVPAILRGEVLCCLGYSEPDAGSDVAAATTRAVRDGDDWVINGQKMFTTLAHESAYVFLLTRTNPDAAKHRGLTMFLVPMATPGIEVVPVHTLGGERTNLTFYSDVRVPDSCRVGEVDGGWEVMNVALAFERQPIAQGESARLYRRVVEWTSEAEPAGSRVDEEPGMRARLARIAIDNEVGRLLGWRMTAAIARGALPHIEGSMAKLFSSEAFVRASAELLDVLGSEAVLAHGEPEAPVDGWAEHAHRHAQVMTIYAGTSEIQRSIIAERALGLPRSPR